MPLYFFLSYAQADHGPAIQRFFRDLSDSIRIREKLADTEIVGCSSVEHSETRDEGLRTSRMMLALVSSNYLRDRAAEQEWHAFELRKAGILRINWSQNPEPLPKIIADAQIFSHQLNGNGHVPLGVMITAIGKYKSQYAEYVNSLADYIIASAASPELPEPALVPDKTSKTLNSREEPDMKSQPTNPPQDEKPDRFVNHNVNQIVIDGAFVRGVVEQIKGTGATPAPVSNVDSVAQTAQPKKVPNEKYRVFTIDNDPGYMERIETPASFSSDFDLTPYKDFTQLVNDVTELLKDRNEPDLIVANPALSHPETHNYPLIQTLLEKEVPSAILAISKDPKAIRSLTVGGLSDLVAVLPESFTSVELLKLMGHWAKIGRDKRYRRGRFDERPVFLSFASEDEAMATKICKWLELRQIGVWYSPHTLKAGDPWLEKIKQGLANAAVFIALVSDEYPKSKYCDAELANILKRWQPESTDLLAIPVRYKSPTTALENPQIKMFMRQQAVTISATNWVPALQEILTSVQNFLMRRQNQL